MSYYKFSYNACAVGAAAQFTRLDEARDLNIVIPALGSAALSISGGLASAHQDAYEYKVIEPRPRTLLAVKNIDTKLRGELVNGKYETEIASETDSLDILEKLHVDLIKAHMLSTRDLLQPVAVISTAGNEISGMRLGNVTATIKLDEEPLTYSGNTAQIAAFYAAQTTAYRATNSWRFNTDADSAVLAMDSTGYTYSLVREITLSGPQSELDQMKVDGYTIIWDGFGKIILGEVHVIGDYRRLSLLRLVMGSDAEGTGAGGEGSGNGSGGGS